jgi:hypothetical protein
MSNSTARTIRLIKAQAVRDAAAIVRGNKYAELSGDGFKSNYNMAMEDAADLLLGIANDLENQK